MVRVFSYTLVHNNGKNRARAEDTQRVRSEFPLVWTGSLLDGKFWVVRDTLMETLGPLV
jgi:hypothetical protein